MQEDVTNGNTVDYINATSALIYGLLITLECFSLLLPEHKNSQTHMKGTKKDT
jgi:hypothetical protein